MSKYLSPTIDRPDNRGPYVTTVNTKINKQPLTWRGSFIAKRKVTVNWLKKSQNNNTYSNLVRVFEAGNIQYEQPFAFQVIKKKAWRAVAKELNLPASITSAAFTMRSQWVRFPHFRSNYSKIQTHIPPLNLLQIVRIQNYFKIYVTLKFLNFLNY